jgi:integrase/recombinase XerC
MIESFLKYLQFEKRLSRHTTLAYKNDLLQFNAFLNTNYPGELIEHTNHGIIRSWIINLVEEDLQNRSVNRKIACLRSFYKFLIRQGVIDKNPMTKIRVLKSKKSLPEFINENDMINLLDKVEFTNDFKGCRDRLILELFYATGIRLSELINLKENRVNLQDATIKVLGKRNKERVIPFPSNIVSLIKEYTVERNKEVENNSDLLFVTNKGTPLYPMMVYRIVNRYIQQHTSSSKQSPHVMRHTFATHLLNKGAEINAVKDLLGHTSLAATQVYTHNSIDKLKKVFEQAHPKA